MILAKYSPVVGNMASVDEAYIDLAGTGRASVRSATSGSRSVAPRNYYNNGAPLFGGVLHERGSLPK